MAWYGRHPRGIDHGRRVEGHPRAVGTTWVVARLRDRRPASRTRLSYRRVVTEDHASGMPFELGPIRPPSEAENRQKHIW